MAQIPEDVRTLKSPYEKNRTAVTAGNTQYIATASAVGVFSNFFLIANSLLNLNLLEERLFMNNLAKSYLSTFEAMNIINGLVGEAKPEALLPLDEMKIRCETWLKNAKRSTSSGNETGGPESVSSSGPASTTLGQ